MKPESQLKHGPLQPAETLGAAMRDYVDAPPSEQERRNARFARWLGIAFRFGPAPLAAVIALLFRSREPLAIFAVVVFCGLVGELCGRISSHFTIKARRMAAVDATVLLRSDPRPPVVYLRPFAADHETIRKVPLTRWHTDEEQLERAMRDIGPFIAIGRPVDVMRPAGAARLYVPDDAWQTRARQLIGDAGLIVMRIGGGTGLWFELEAAVAARPLQRLLLLVPHDRSAYEAFKRRAQTLLPPLPELSTWSRISRARARFRAIIWFDPQGEARVVDVPAYRVPLLKRCPLTPLAPTLRLALEPLYRDLGLPWSPPPNNKHTMILLGCAVLSVFTLFCFAMALAGAPDL